MTKSDRRRTNRIKVKPPPGLAHLRVAQGYETQQSFADASGLSTDTISRIEFRKRVSPGSLKIYGSKLGLELQDLAPVHQRTNGRRSNTDNEVGTWTVVRSGPWMTAANGLQWKFHELLHKNVPGRKARGKLYDLSEHLAWQALDEIKHLLTRHAEISDRIKNLSPHVGHNLDSFLDESRPQHWWVIDNWIDGHSLEETLAREPLQNDRALRVMMEVAEVLQLLHREGLVYRALAPQSIYLTQIGAIVSDFELTKIVEGGRTVAPTDKWPQWDVFIAPEVRDREKAKPTADLYSWAMILAHCLSGQRPGGPVPAKQMITSSTLASRVKDFAVACLESSKKRPPSFDPLLALRKQAPHSSGGT